MQQQMPFVCAMRTYVRAQVAASTTNMGGGKVGLEDRLGGKAGHAKFQCHICKQTAPDLKSMQMHHEARHPKEAWEPEKCADLHATHGGTTKGVAVRGSTKK
ncbi:hypothetical protein Vafri_7701 [Volvox africanus]|uniref:Uncharacterized protein n=1 Tax=Volvox africanus TaxID=51714 RepID=A0A8J4B1P8_9CHLO|nr:hypothetical protein Vafri_7701 [Volvox africanus]